MVLHAYDALVHPEVDAEDQKSKVINPWLQDDFEASLGYMRP